MDTAKMTEQLKAVWNKIKTAIKGVSKKVWIIAGVLVILAAAAIAFYLNTRPYSALVSEATSQEITTIINWLGSQGVSDYKVEGNTILVPERMAPSLKASLLTETYSSGSSGFSGYFENVSALSTEKERGTALIIALQEEIAAVARAFPGVVSASVSIAEGEDLNYVLDNNNLRVGSVGILLTMSGNQMLTNAQANALRNYVAYGVKGMSVDRVSIGDTNGNTYNSTSLSGVDQMITASQLKAQLEEQYNNRINTQVRQALNSMFGAGNYTVSVNCVVDVDTKEVDEHTVILPDEAYWNESGGAGIIGSRVYSAIFRASDEAVAGGIVGTTTNSDNNIPTYPEQAPDGDLVDGVISAEGQIDYDNSTVDTHRYVTAGYVTDCTVAVTVNATTANANGQVLDVVSLRTLVAGAAGITPVVTETMTAEEYLSAKIPVMVYPYYNPTGSEPAPDPAPIVQPWIIYAAIAGLVLFVILLVVLLLLARRRKKKKQAEAAELEKQQAMEQLLAVGVAAVQEGEPAGADVMSLQSERSMELRQEIRKFAEENPEIAAQMVKNWLRGGEESA